MKYSPFFIGLTLFVVVLSFLFKTPLGKSISLSLPAALSLALALAALGGYASQFLISRYGMRPEEDETETLIRRIQVGTTCYVALAQGANDVANAIGPLALIYYVRRHLECVFPFCQCLSIPPLTIFRSMLRN